MGLIYQVREMSLFFEVEEGELPLGLDTLQLKQIDYQLEVWNEKVKEIPFTFLQKDPRSSKQDKIYAVSLAYLLMLEIVKRERLKQLEEEAEKIGREKEWMGSENGIGEEKRDYGR